MKCKQVRILAILALSLLSITSCKKDTTYPVAGLYTGTYTVDNQASLGSFFYSLDIYPDGSLIVKGGGTNNTFGYATGTWVLTGSAFVATTSTIGSSGQPVTQSITATFSNKGTLSNGIWKDIINPYTTPNSGKLSLMQRIN